MTKQINGIAVKNASRPRRIHITPQDIKQGGVQDPSCCAAALACLRDLPCTEARVHISTTYLLEKGSWVRYKTPASLRQEIVSFDRGGGFEPGTYQLSPLQPSHRAHGRRMGGKSEVAKTKPKKRRLRHVTHGVRSGPLLKPAP